MQRVEAPVDPHKIQDSFEIVVLSWPELRLRWVSWPTMSTRIKVSIPKSKPRTVLSTFARVRAGNKRKRFKEWSRQRESGERRRDIEKLPIQSRWIFWLREAVKRVSQINGVGQTTKALRFTSERTATAMARTKEEIERNPIGITTAQDHLLDLVDISLLRHKIQNSWTSLLKDSRQRRREEKVARGRGFRLQRTWQLPLSTSCDQLTWRRRNTVPPHFHSQDYLQNDEIWCRSKCWCWKSNRSRPDRSWRRLSRPWWDKPRPLSPDDLFQRKLWYTGRRDRERLHTWPSRY